MIADNPKAGDAVPKHDLQQKCMSLLRTLNIPVPWSFGRFCALLESGRGRALKIIPSPIPALPGGPCGVCITTHDADYIFLIGSTTSYHREHIALHEIGHLLFGHQDDRASVSDLANLLIPDAVPTLMQKMLGRSTYSSRQEQEAEYLATLIQAKAQYPEVRTTTGGPGTLNVLDRLESSWGRHRKV